MGRAGEVFEACRSLPARRISRSREEQQNCNGDHTDDPLQNQFPLLRTADSLPKQVDCHPNQPGQPGSGIKIIASRFQSRFTEPGAEWKDNEERSNNPGGDKYQEPAHFRLAGVTDCYRNRQDDQDGQPETRQMELIPAQKQEGLEAEKKSA